MQEPSQRVIFHVDVNSAFLSWEAAERLRLAGGPDLRLETAAVGGDMASRHGVILAKSIPAKKMGVRTGESIGEALRKCPSLILVPPNHTLYRQRSRQLMAILEEYTPLVEQASIDEAFMDMTGTQWLWGEPVAVAHTIRERVKTDLGFTVNIGISVNKLLAKMASDFEKPDRVHTLFPEEIPEKMWPLPVGELYSVGGSTQKVMALLGIRTIGDLAKADRGLLVRHLKKQGEHLWAYANGIDVSPVLEKPPESKSIGNSTTTAQDVCDHETAHCVLLSLCESVGERLRAAGMETGALSVGIRTSGLQYFSHQMVLPAPTSVTSELHEFACLLLDQLWDGKPLRLLGVQAARLLPQGAARQLSLFEKRDYDREAKMEQAVDSLRKKYGKNAVRRAVFVEREPGKGEFPLKNGKG